MPLYALPDQILEDIAFHLSTLALLGPPSDLTTFLLLSKRFYHALNLHTNPVLYARIFKAKFDYKAPARRSLLKNAPEQAHELIHRFVRLKRLKQGCDAYPRYIYNDDDRDAGLRLDMWMAFCMFLENDGHNGRQLVQYAHLDEFALQWVRPGGRMHDGKERNRGWIVEREVNALAMWLFWLTDGDRIPKESPEQRHDILTALSPIYAGCFKYLQQTYFPLTHFLIPPLTPPPSPADIPSLFTPSYYHPVPPCVIPSIHTGRTLTLSRPLLIPPVLLSFTSREEHTASLTPFVLPPGFPMTRAEARAKKVGDHVPVGLDYQGLRRIRVERVDWRGGGDADEEDEDEAEASWRFEGEWAKLKGCWDPWNRYCRSVNRLGKGRGVYTPGMLSGSLWIGKWCMFRPEIYNELRDMAANNDHIPSDLHIDADMTAMKAQLRISEHLCHSSDPYSKLPFDESPWGQLGAWIPSGTRFDVQRNTLLVHTDPNGTHTPRTYHYSTYSHDLMDVDTEEEEDDNSPFGNNTHDILLTADTEVSFANVWGRVSFTGRVRPWDGLVVLVRDPQAGLGRWIFRGYLHCGGTLVGRWRETATQPDLVGWEGTWYLQREVDV